MTLQELLRDHYYAPPHSVPDWMLGCFRRRCISFANGDSDDQTIVFWVQSRNFSIDLRLPRKPDQVPARKLEDYSAAELQVLANYEGWEAISHWNGQQMHWSGGTAFQVTDRWPEPAELRRVGNCMTEFAPSGAYVEDWRLQPSAPGPLVGLRLVAEYCPRTGLRSPRGGGLIICGDYAALVLGRTSPLAAGGAPLPEQVARAQGDPGRLQQLFEFETSVASGNAIDGFSIRHSTVAARVDEPLLPDGRFEPIAESNQVQFQFTRAGDPVVWVMEIDVLEPRHEFALSTAATASSRDWFQEEAATLTRYTGVLA